MLWFSSSFLSGGSGRMGCSFKDVARSLTAAVLVAVFAMPNDAVSQAAPHLVSPSDLTKATVDSSQQRQRNIDTLDRFISSPKAQQALESAHIDSQQMKKRVSGLSDE